MARKMEPGKKTDRPTADSIIPYLIIQAKDVVAIDVADVDLSFALDKSTAGNSSRQGRFSLLFNVAPLMLPRISNRYCDQWS